jgi:hypothetical protein
MQVKDGQGPGKEKFIQLKSQKETNAFRAKLVEEQGGFCPVSGWEITTSTSHLDHDHQTGLYRAALHPAVNRSLSQDSMRRFGISYEDQPRILRAMADYIESNVPTDYLHHSTKPKDLIIKKSNYQTLGFLIMDNEGSLPSWWGYKMKKPTKRRKLPASGQKLTKRLAALYSKYNLEPEYYSVAKNKKPFAREKDAMQEDNH